MKTQDENLSPLQSLDIITSMIQEAKGRVQKNNFYFLLWGWVIVVANLGMYILTKLEYEMPYIMWVITVPAWIYSMVKGYRQGREGGTRSSHLDRITGTVWITYGVVIFTLVAFGRLINYQLNPAILLVTAIPTFTSGMIINFKPLMMGGAIFWIASIISFLLPLDTQPLVGAVAIACGYLVPGYLLKAKRNE
jgi:hypothetical protein